MKKLIIILLLTVNTVFGGTISDNLAKLVDDPSVIIFIKGQRVHKLINEEGDDSYHWLKASYSETWDGIKTSDIARFVGINVKHAAPADQHETFHNLLDSVPDSHGDFLKLNCLIETAKKNPHLTRLVFRWTLQNAKQFGIVVGHEIMAVNPAQYMEYRYIVDELAPEMQNTFELGYVWLTPRSDEPNAPITEIFATQ